MSDKISTAISALQKGSFVVISDDENRENEGDLVIAAQYATPEKIAFMIRHTAGVLVVPMTATRLEELRLQQMVAENTESHRTAFTVSVDYAHDTTTGISAEDRTKTIRALADPTSQPTDFRRPGHIFPLLSREGGVLKRAGHTEASIDLARMGGLEPVCVICELIHDDGTMLRAPAVEAFAQKHQFPFLTVADIIRYRRRKEKLVRRVSEATVLTAYGEFTGYVYVSELDDMEHFVLAKGDFSEQDAVLVRVHSECLTGDVFGSRYCDCGTQLQKALQKIAEEGTGVVVYLRGHEGRGIGLGHKLQAYALQQKGMDTVDANRELGLPVDSREYGIGAQILVDLGVHRLRLMTNNPDKYGGLEGFNLEIVERVPLQGRVYPENRNYLQTKKQRMGHLLDVS